MTRPDFETVYKQVQEGILDESDVALATYGAPTPKPREPKVPAPRRRKPSPSERAPKKRAA